MLQCKLSGIYFREIMFSENKDPLLVTMYHTVQLILIDMLHILYSSCPAASSVELPEQNNSQLGHHDVCNGNLVKLTARKYP